MESLEIVCESCDSRMRLSSSLLNKITGKSGRVTCRECQNKVVLDATGSEVRVTAGGYVAGALDLEEIEEFTEAPPSVDPHLSELPLEPVGSVSPLHPEDAGAAESFKVRTPGPDDVAAAMRYGLKSEEPFEAPAPDFASDGSLSPHSIDAEDEDLVPLGREFNSSPFSSERDASYNSLFPEMKPKAAPHAQDAPAPVFSRTPSPPKRGELHRMKSDPEIFAGDPGTAPVVASTVVEMGPDGQLINQSDKKRRTPEQHRSSNWIPWTVAAIALLGLGVSVTVNRSTPVVNESTQTAAEPVQAPAALDAQVGAEEPASAELERIAESDEAEETVDTEPVAVEAGESELEESSGEVAALPKKTERKAEESRDLAAASAQGDAESPEDDDMEADEADVESGEGTEEPVLSPFSTSAAATALREATALASACRKTGDPTGITKVVVTFAPSGRVTRAAITGAPFAGTQTGGCIASRFRTARVPAFSGEHVTVSKTVSIR